MKDLRRASMFVAILAGTGVSVAALSVGCSNDETGIAGDASTDGTADGHALDTGRPDVTRPRDSGRDTGRDGGRDTGADSGFDAGHDAGQDVTGDAPPDTSSTDAKTDTNLDAPPPSDGPVDAGGQVLAYQNLINKTFCERIAQCCNSPQTFSPASCEATYATVGGAVGNVGNAVPTSGHLVLSPSDVSNCIATIDQLPCAATTSQQNLAAIQACAAGLKGTLTMGQSGCLSSWDCVQPAFCKPGSDGGTCVALLGSTDPCTDTDFSQDCNSLGDVPGLFCGPFGSPSPICLSAENTGGVCLENQQCLSTYCGENDAGASVCVTSEVFAPNYCVGPFPPDAG
jgi:hypothetical protein